VISRRGIIRSLLFAPAIIRTPGLLMPIRPLLEDGITEETEAQILALIFNSAAWANYGMRAA